MIVRKVFVLSESINKKRKVMYELAGEKGYTDPRVIKISQQLDKEIFKWQKLGMKNGESSFS